MIAPGDVLLDRYKIDTLIARGGMADVFLARDPRLDRNVAIKAFRIGAADPARFDAETKLLARLTHRNLVAVFDAGEHDGVPFVVLQHVPGPTLAMRLGSDPLPEGEVIPVAADVACALEYIHAQRIVHRDVKPSNIFLHPDRRALLGDFGVAILLDATRLTTDAAIIGTAAYLAPEQATGDTVTEAADVYALGLVLLEILTGRPAFTGSFPEVITAKLGRDPQVPVDLEEPWPALLAAMTNRNPALRPSAAEVGDVLHNPAMPGTLVARRAPAQPSPVETTVLRHGDSSATEIAPAIAPVVAGPGRLPRHILAVVAAGALALLVIVAALAAGGSDGEERPPATPASGDTSASTTATVATTTAPPTTTAPSTCAALEGQKRAIEQEKQRAEQTYRDDKESLERVKSRLEDQKKDIDEQKQAAGC